MPFVNDIAAAIEEIAPRSLAGEWDNVGTLVNCGGSVDKVLVCLDITADVVAEAEATACQLIVSHHPVVFRPMRQISHNDVVFRLIKKGISAICAHSNLDAAAGGVNDILAALFGLAEPELFAGFGRVGRLKSPSSATELAKMCIKKFGSDVKVADAGRPVQRLAVLGGSGGGLLAEALAARADCILTGEADHHDAIDAKAAGLSLVVAGHFATEFPVVPVLANWLGKQFSDIRVQTSRCNKDPFTYFSAKGMLNNKEQ